MKGFKKYLFTLLISVSIFLVGVNYVNAEGTAGEILLTKTATKKDKEKGRSADVTLTVNANGFTTVDKTDVVLVLDRSTSMDGTSMKNTKKAANDLVNLLITDKTKDNTRAAIVTYGSNLLTSYTSNSLTNNATALKNTINSIPNSMDDQGTNVHAGLIKAEELLKNSGDDTQKIVILLSDGEPTFYIGTDNKRHGMGKSDNYENDYCSWNYRKNIGECTEYRDSKNVVMTYDYDFFSTIYTTKDAYKPSTNTNNKATTMKANGTKIYAIGFGNGASGNAYEFLGKVASTPTDKYRYTASDYTGLKKAFNKIVNDFTTVATDAVVTDIIPKGFTIKEGTLPAGATAIENSDGTTTITWVIGDVKSTDNNRLTYTVEAKDGHYGSMYTNASATINAKSVDGNPKYGSSNPISLDFDKPYVAIPGVTVKDDYYNIKQGTTFTTPVKEGILDNDKFSDIHEDENATVTNEIVLVYDGTTNGKAENITLNQDGSFSYNATKDTLGKITYKYYVKTTVTIGNVTEVVKSNTTTITLDVIKNQTTYVINYLEKGTNKALIKEVNGTGNVYDEITLASVKKNITGYVYDSVSIDPLVLSDNTTLNVMNIYYTKRADLSYTVNYLEKDTNVVLRDSKVFNNVEFNAVINGRNEVIAIDGYVFDSVNPQELTITTGSNVINIYYTKRTDLSYTVNYLEKDTNVVLRDSKVFNNVEFEKVINASNEIIEIDGYVFNSVNPEELTVGTNSNVMNIYYTKRADLGYTVNYLEKDTNKVLNESKKVNNVEFEKVINASNEIIAIDGYVFNSVNPEELTVGTSSNVINIYYTKRADLSYTVNYLEKDTNKVINQSKEVNNVEFEKVINASDEIITINGYKFVSADKNTIVVDIENNEINLYYEAVNGTVKSIYVDKDGNEISESVITEGRVGTEYKTSSKEIAKYYLVKTIGEETGSYSEEGIVITYVYDLVPVTGIDMNSNSSYMFIGTFGLALVILFVRKKRYN